MTLIHSVFIHFKHTVMTITGRLTADAVVSTTKDSRKVVNFSVAVNETYKPKGGERTKVTTFYACSFWRTEKVAAFLKKGTLLQVNGRVELKTYVSKDGELRASLNCHVNDFNILAWPKDVEVVGDAVKTPAVGATKGDDDMPF